MGRLTNDEEDGAVEALVTLYRGGMSMEAIAEAMDLPLVYVSHVVHALGLGDERYGGHYPSTGSVPVVHNATTQGATIRAFQTLNRGGTHV